MLETFGEAVGDALSTDILPGPHTLTLGKLALVVGGIAAITVVGRKALEGLGVINKR